MAAQISEKFAGNGLATVVTDTKFEGILRPTTSNDTGRYDRTGFAAAHENFVWNVYWYSAARVRPGGALGTRARTLVTVVAYLLLITMICADFAFLSFKGNPSVPARAPVLLASEAGRIKALACRLLRAHRLRRNGRTPLWRAGAAENRLR
ncbi:hypothetical protein B0H16DRAFT_991184 [Mycena metata]|uniref:Uncharacterized protein n=1 Tax=Mycena metata TaxID=1033252 RepID=A0AAD7IL73_9AGAR|nr:hypothetical protein B0H16DRAFT_991184 [Mycena metata]